MRTSTRPPALDRLLDEIAACERDARALVDVLSEEQMNWQARPGRSWSIAQCLDHLAKINPLYLQGFAAAVARAREEGEGGPFVDLRPGWWARRFLRSLEPPAKLKARARPAFVPASSLGKAEAIEGFIASHASYRALVEACADVDTNRIIAPNPLFPMIRMTVSTALLVIPAHDRRHLWQARKVKESGDVVRW